jgi:uncharacterized protein
MTATTEPAPRIVSLDVIRGIAVMGILAMNIIAFAMPFQAYMNPRAYGGAEGVDLWAWIISFIFVDGKMRALFSLLFGASMLLVIERAEAAGRKGSAVHVRRMLWLLAFGLFHFFFIWYGDILTAYALIGLIAALFARKAPASLMKWAIGFLVLGVVSYALFFASPMLLEAAAKAPDADPALVAQWESLKGELAVPSDAVIAETLARYRGDYLGIVRYNFTEQWAFLIQGVLMFGAETLGLMLLGMWALKSGFLTGAWERARYARLTAILLGIGLPVYAALAYVVVQSDFGVSTTLAVQGFLAAFVRPVVMMGYAALILVVLKGGADGWLVQRIGAAGRAAFTNYLGTSIVATFIFYGWGLGLFGTLGRAESYLVVLGIWVLMLLWSKPWLDRYRYGPFEWLWRSLARGRVEPMRKAAIAAAASS